MYVGKGQFEVTEKPKPVIVEKTDAVVRVTLSSICTSDLHIKMAVCQGLFPVSLSDMRWLAMWSRLGRRSGK